MTRGLKLGTKFTLFLTIAFLVGLILTGVTLHFTIQHEAEEDVANKAEILTKTINSVRYYTSNNIEPLLQGQANTSPTFIREMVPAFAARTVFEQFRNRPEYSSFFYKEATLNPTNPQDQADHVETQLIEQFRSQPEVKQLSGYRTIEGKNLFYIARPIPIDKASCLKCHGSPATAPKNMIATYGQGGGFGWRLGEIVGAQTVYVPVGEVAEHEFDYLRQVMGILLVIFIPVMVLMNWLLKQAVIQPIQQLTTIARNVGQGSLTKQQIRAFDAPSMTRVAQRADEPGELARAFQYMAHEVTAREQNLTQAVQQRTAQLAASMEDANQAKARAEGANQAKSRFLSTMSHELRTPLNAILGFTQLLMRGNSLQPKQQEYLSIIHRSGDHLLTLINDVLEMSKIEAGQATLHITQFDLFALLDWLQQLFTLKAESKGLKLLIQRDRRLPQYLRTDESKLRQVLVNLIGNAIKFTQTGSVTLRVAVASSTSLVLDVTDTGPGIAADELQLLFQPFAQTETGRAAQAGTGLGLPISQEFVQLMGGQLTVQSQLGSGTTFRFSIQTEPLDVTPIIAPSVSQTIVGLAAGQATYRILVVDDGADNRQWLMELLTPIGFDVRVASSGIEAIALWQQWQPHLIWMDLQMSQMDGYEATRQIKASGQSAPVVIAFTSSVFEEERQSALAIGFDDFVRKPARAEVILEKLAEHLSVRYRYDHESIAHLPDDSRGIHPAPDDASPFSLTVMPAEWIEQVRQAATQVNAKRLQDLIRQIPASESQLADRLQQLVQDFCFEEIVALSHSAAESH